MRNIQKEKDFLNSIYIYDSKTSANPTKIDSEDIKYEFTFANRLLDNDYIETNTSYGFEEEYIFDTFIITEDSYLIKIDGVRQKINYATREHPKIKLSDINNVSRVLEYLLNYCKEDREILSIGNNDIKKVSTNYDYIRTCIEQMLLNNLTKDEFELVYGDIKRNVKDVIADRLSNVYLGDVTYSDLRGFKCFGLDKDEALELKNSFLSTYKNIIRMNNFNNTDEAEAFEFLTSIGYQEEVFSEIINNEFIGNIISDEMNFKHMFENCFSGLSDIEINTLDKRIICEMIWNCILTRLILYMKDEYYKYYISDFMESKTYINVKNHNIDLIMNFID